MLHLILILTLLLQPAPRDVQLEWTGPQTARISWEHPAGANYWAVYKQTPWGWLTIAERFDAEPGRAVVLMGPRGEYSPESGAHYLIQVAERDPGSHATEWSRVSEVFTLGDWPEGWTLLPVVRR